MTGQQIIDYCLSKPGAYLDYPFGTESTIVKVKKRIFAQVFELKGEPKATFNCDAATGDLYRQLFPEAVTRGYHCPPVQQPYFNTVSLNGDVPDEEIYGMIDHSYTVVVKKLPKYIRQELEEDKYSND